MEAPGTKTGSIAARKERARAFIRQELKKGHAWSEKRYEYDTQPVPKDDSRAICQERGADYDKTIAGLR